MEFLQVWSYTGYNYRLIVHKTSSSFEIRETCFHKMMKNSRNLCSIFSKFLPKIDHFRNVQKLAIFLIFSFNIVKAHRPSSVRPSSVRKLSHFQLLLWNCWTEFNETWQDASFQRPLPSLCFFGPIGKNKMAAPASDWLRYFQILLWNRWMEFNETWQEARSQCPLPSLCFSGRSEKQDGRHGLWLAETFSTSSLKPMNRIQWNLTGSKISTSSTKFVFFGPVGKKDGRPGLLLAEIFSTSSLKSLNGIQRNLRGSKISMSSIKFVFFGPIGKTIWPPWPLIGWDIFDLFSETAERNSTKLDRKQDLNVFYHVCVIGADRKNKMAALASDWTRHFQLLLWNRWTEFNETWQEATFLTSSTKFVFFGPIWKTRWSPWPLIGWEIFDFSDETAERNSKKLDRKQDLKVL